MDHQSSSPAPTALDVDNNNNNNHGGNHHYNSGRDESGGLRRNPQRGIPEDVLLQRMLERCTSHTVEPVVVRESFRRAHMGGEVYPYDYAYYPTLVTNEQVAGVYRPFISEVIRRKMDRVSFFPIYNTSSGCSTNLDETVAPSYCGDEVAAAGLQDTNL